MDLQSVVAKPERAIATVKGGGIIESGRRYSRMFRTWFERGKDFRYLACLAPPPTV